MSKSLVVKLKPTSNVAISNEKNFSISVSSAYWSSFQLNNLMHPLVAVFAKACCGPAHNRFTKPTQNNMMQQLAKVYFKYILVINEGTSWKLTDSCLQLVFREYTCFR